MYTSKYIVMIIQLLSLAIAGPTGQHFVHEPVDVTAVSGEHLQLQCVVRNMKGECQWTKDEFGLGTDPNLPGYPRYSMDERNPGDCHLNIYPVLPEDEGEYQCQVGAVPGIVAIKSDTAIVRVIAPPSRPYIRQAKLTDTLEVLEGEEIELDCETHGAKPAAEIQWTDENKKVIMSNLVETVTKNKKTNTFKTVSTLTLKPTKKMTLTCSAFSDDFKEPVKSRQLDIIVKYKPKLDLILTNEKVQAGSSLVVKCSSQAYPTQVTYKWFVNDVEMEEKTDTLTIENISKDYNNAVLKCVAENVVGKSKTSIILNVEYVPKIVSHPTSKIAKYGDTVTFTCLAEGNPEPHYVWMKGKSQELVGVTQDLTLTAADDTEDYYTCKVFVEGHETLTSDIASLHIMRKPKVVTEKVKHAKVGDDVILQCKVESLSSNTKVTWTKNNSPIDRENTKHKIIYADGLHEFESDLIIYTVEASDFTNYGCFSSNEVGTDYKVFNLEEEEESDFLTLVITINTIVGFIILVFIIIFHKRKKRTEDTELPTVQREVLRPIYKGKDASVLEELLDNGMHEEYLQISREYFDHMDNEKVKDLRIV